ncbi:MAG TPA: LytTR family DNA-binding domain-containing protein [Saprospiraceae bacterium]|jgi:DNA-binding LytR/AlgR family response regulator|nr:LytTR family DNA-binding domain-containing protein [Saprospiraceae bacterium]
MTFIALDDEPIALAIIERYARNVPDLQLVATFTDAAAAAEFLRNNTVDLLLSDINMPDVSGLQFVRDLPDERPMVIFVTAYKEHAHEGFDLNVIDYLVKPVSPERFNTAIQKAAGLLELRRKAEAAEASALPDEFFFVFSEYQQVKITISDLLYVEAMGDYVKLFLSTQPKPVLTLERMKILADRLQQHGFRRIHRSYLVNMKKVAALQKARLRVADVWLPVGETYMEGLKDGRS